MKIKRLFQTLDDLKRVVVLFEECLEGLDHQYKNGLIGNSVSAKAISSLKDVLGVTGMTADGGKNYFGILNYHTAVVIPDDIKAEIEEIFDELFYDE